MIGAGVTRVLTPSGSAHEEVLAPGNPEMQLPSAKIIKFNISDAPSQIWTCWLVTVRVNSSHPDDLHWRIHNQLPCKRLILLTHIKWSLLSSYCGHCVFCDWMMLSAVANGRSWHWSDGLTMWVTLKYVTNYPEQGNPATRYHGASCWANLNMWRVLLS